MPRRKSPASTGPLPPGPATTKDGFDWPIDIPTRLETADHDGQAEARCSRLRAMTDGVQWNFLTLYSGFECPRESIRCGHRGLKSMHPGWHMPPPKHHSTCDNGALQLKILKKISSTMDDGKSCNFADLNDRLPQDVCEKLDELEVGQTAKVAAKRKCREAQYTCLQEHKSIAWTPASVSWCHQHNDFCSIFMREFADAATSTAQVDLVPGQAASSSAASSGTPGTTRKLPECAPASSPSRRKVGGDDDGSSSPPKGLKRSASEMDSAIDEGQPGVVDEPPRKQLRISIAGTCCQGWSSEGKQLREAHHSERAHAVYQIERERACQFNKEDGFMQECIPLYAWESKLAHPLAATHTTRRILVGPKLLGYPANRQRSFVIGVGNNGRIRWVGPEQQHVQQDFESIFARKVVATANIYLNASDQEINQELRRKAAVQKNFWPAEYNAIEAIRNGAQVLEECLFPGSYCYYGDWEAVRVQEGMADKAWFADCDHRPGPKAPRGGSAFPVVLCHGSVVAHHLGRLVTIKETLSSHGFHLHSGDASSTWGVSPMAAILGEASIRQLSTLSGNGMHLPSVLAVFCYMLANCVWVEDLPRSVQEVCLGRRGGTQFFEDIGDEEDME